MITRLILPFFAMMFATSAIADPFVRTTDQFGFFGIDIAEEFRLGATCSVSNGEIRDATDFIELLPAVGNYLAYGTKLFSLKKGAAACGVGQYQSKARFYELAESNGINMDSGHMRQASR